MPEEKVLKVLSRLFAFYGQKVSSDRTLLPEDPNIKGQNNGRQITAALVTGLVVGIGAALNHLQSHPELLRDALSPVVFAIVSAGIVSAVNWFRGRDVNEIVDSIIGEKDEE